MKCQSISVIVPIFNQTEHLDRLLRSLELQTMKPDEIVIIDSSTDNSAEASIYQFNSSLNINYFHNNRVHASSHKATKLRYFYNFFDFRSPNSTRLFPGEAINFGILKAKNDVVALLDVCTIPKPEWIEDYINILNKGNVQIIFGSTLYIGENFIQKAIKASTFGNFPIETNPGTLIKRSILLENPLMEGVRAGADIEWRPRIKESYEYFSPKQHYLSYDNLPVSIFSAIKKFFIYQIHASIIRVQSNFRDLFFSLSLIFLTLIIYKWNNFFAWLLFIPNLMKAFLLSTNLFLLFLLVLKRFKNSIFNKISLTFTEKTFKYLFFVTLFFICFRWNAVFASWAETSSFYVPHITKIYIFSLFIIAVSYRGIVFPLKNGYSIHELIPFRFLSVGLVGLLLDCAKLPGFILGSAFSMLGITHARK